MVGVNSTTISLILPSTLSQIRDRGNVLYDRINPTGYEGCQDDIEAVSGIAEDVRDALLDYQVSGPGNAHAAQGY